MIITIDGPAGAGKSSAARALARRLGFEFLDTGATYRAVAYAAQRDGIDLNDGPALAAWLDTLRIELRPGQVWLNGAEVTQLIRSPDVTSGASRVAVLPVVRHYLAELQRTLATGRDVVSEGRDQGTVVFPHAEKKFFLVADPVERARRRHRDLVARGEQITLEEVLRAQDERDRRDAGRDLAPMVPAADAIILDSTSLTPEEVLERMEREVRRC